MRDIFLRLVVGGLLGLLVNPLTVVHAQADNDQSKLDAVDSAGSGLSRAALMEAMNRNAGNWSEDRDTRKSSPPSLRLVKMSRSVFP